MVTRYSRKISLGHWEWRLYKARGLFRRSINAWYGLPSSIQGFFTAIQFAPFRCTTFSTLSGHTEHISHVHCRIRHHRVLQLSSVGKGLRRDTFFLLDISLLSVCEWSDSISLGRLIALSSLSSRVYFSCLPRGLCCNILPDSLPSCW